MTITVNNLGKRYNREWIFRNLSYEFVAGKKYAITGSNGSGKSTLLQVLAGAVTYNEGKVVYKSTNNIEESNHYQYIAIATPYLELIEEMTAKEFLAFHSSFKSLTLPVAEMLKIVGLSRAVDKQIRYYSSGMKQRLKLAQAFFTATPVLLLDEPITNLDAEGIELYHNLINNYTADKLLIVCSNDQQEYHFCDEVINITQYKP